MRAKAEIQLIVDLLKRFARGTTNIAFSCLKSFASVRFVMGLEGL
jgi:hypothetical protein